MPWRGDSNEYPQYMFLWTTKENYRSTIIKYPPYLCISHTCYGISSKEIGIFHPDISAMGSHLRWAYFTQTYLLWDLVTGDRHISLRPTCIRGDRHISPRPTCFGISSQDRHISPRHTCYGISSEEKAYFRPTRHGIPSEETGIFTQTYLLGDLVWGDRHISLRPICNGILSEEIGKFHPDLPIGSRWRREVYFTQTYLLWDLIGRDRHISPRHIGNRILSKEIGIFHPPTCYGVSFDEIGIIHPDILAMGSCPKR